MKRNWLRLAAITILCAGCGGSGSSPEPAHVVNNQFANATNASLEAIDCKREFAYVPISPAGAVDAEVAVLDLADDPNTTDPRTTTIDLGHGGVATSATIAPKQGIALVISGSIAATGFVDEINESDNMLVAGSPFSFPIGGQPNFSDGIVFDSNNNSALVSMTSTPVTCPGNSGTPCTGMAVFSLDTNTFAPLMQFATPVNNFGFDQKAEIAIGPSDPVSPIPYAMNIVANTACTLTDDSLTSLNGDADGAAVDPTTGIWVLGNFVNVQTSVINLSGASFSGTPPSCTLDESGAPPSNSLNLNTSSGDFLPGVTINPQTHQAVLSGLLDNQVSLLSLPKGPVRFISPTDLSAVNAVLPTEPDGLLFESSIVPYADAIDTCNNRAYIVNQDETFMAEIDLKKLQTNPNAISAPLPAGNCAGTSTTLSCDNLNGVRFFPLPGV
jgi:hypothetical protein